MEYDPNKPTSSMPAYVSVAFEQEAAFLLDELRNNKLRIVTQPAPRPNFEGHKVRKVEIANPSWYSELFWQYKHFRRDRSLKALDRIANGQDRPYKIAPFRYDSIYRELIADRLVNAYDEYNIPEYEDIICFLEEKVEAYQKAV